MSSTVSADDTFLQQKIAELKKEYGVLRQAAASPDQTTVDFRQIRHFNKKDMQQMMGVAGAVTTPTGKKKSEKSADDSKGSKDSKGSVASTVKSIPTPFVMA